MVGIFTDKQVWQALVQYFSSSAELAVAEPYRTWTIALAVALTLAGLWAYVRGKFSFAQAVACPCLAAWCSLVLTSTVLARTTMMTAVYKLTPFWSYVAISSGQRHLLGEVILNVLLLLPVGLLLPFLWKRADAKRVVGAGFLFSVGIELLQLATMRGWFEFDDIFHNTLGTALGYGLYRMVRAIRERNCETAGDAQGVD